MKWLLLSLIVMLTACGASKEVPHEILFRDQPFCAGLTKEPVQEICGLDVYEFPNGILIYNKNQYSSISAEIYEERESSYGCKVIHNAIVVVGETVCTFRVVQGQVK